MMGMDALALVEVNSVARGYRVVDALVKKAPVVVLEANLVEPGLYLILFCGGVAEVQMSHAEALAIAGDTLVDEMLLPRVHGDLLAGLRGTVDCNDPDTVGVVEGRRVSSTLEACDRALKEAEVALAGLRVTPGLGGKAFFVVQGIQHDVEAALEVASGILHQRGALVHTELIPRPHEDFLAHVLRPAPFSLEN